MPATTSFAITISDLACDELPAPGAGRHLNAFIKLNFDNFKSHETKVKTKDSTPRWPDAISFVYTTKYADCLARKMLWLEAYDYNRFSTNEFLGVARVDLYTCATGPVAHKLTLRDGRKTRGTISFKVSMVQIATLEARITGLTVPPALVPAGARVRLALAPPATPAVPLPAGGGGGAGAGTTAGVFVGESGASTLAHPDSLFAQGAVPDVMATAIRITVVTGAGAGTAVADGTVAVKDVRSFVAERPQPLKVRLAGPAVTDAAASVATGTIAFTGFPQFVQMVGGVHTDAGITGATHPYEDTPNKPVCPVEGFAAVATPSAALSSPAGAGGGAGAAAGAAPMARAPSLRALNTEIVPVAPASAVADLPRVPLSQPLYKPGETTAPPLGSRLFAATAGLPACWIRRLDPAHPERVAFENLTTNRVELELPTDSEYVVVIPPAGEGPLGIAFEPNFSGVARHGWRSGRRNSGYDIGAVVRGIKEGSYAGTQVPRLRPGHHLIAVNGMSTARMPFDASIGLVKAAGRPLVLRFHDPYAVPMDVAATVMSPTTPVPGSYTYSLSPAGVAAGSNTPGPNTPLSSIAAVVNLQRTGAPGTGGVAAGGEGGGGGGQVMTKRMMAQAQNTLDLALDVLASVDLHAPLVETRDLDGKPVPTDPAAAAAAAQAAAVHKALSDPGFLRSINAVITGASRDVLPAPLQRTMAGLGTDGVGMGPEGEEDEGAAQPAPVTDDRVASRALKVMTVLTATDEAALSESSPAAYMPGVRGRLRERAVRMAELGMFRRAMDAMGNRGDVDFAASTVRAVHKVMEVYDLNPKDMGLDQETVVELTTTMRKDNFEPMMAEAGTLVRVLTADNPEQDGASFVQACIRATGAIIAMNAAGYRRVMVPAPAGSGAFPSWRYARMGEAAGVEACPEVVAASMRALCDVDRRTRLLDDGAVVPGPDSLFAAFAAALVGQAEDPFVVGVLIAAVAKLSASPANAAMAVGARLLDSTSIALSRHGADARTSEGATAFYFNVGRDLDQSEALLSAGAVARCCELAKRWIVHRANAGGTPCACAPDGREEEIAEGVVFRGNDKWARDRNSVRPRLVRICINVLINLACYRTPNLDGETSVSLIARHRGVDLLGDVLRTHLAEPSVVTSVLNCAANIAFKNPDVQLALGERMMDAIVLAGYQFRSDITLLSMALRTIGNLTNQDANIYRSLGFGVARMISLAMRENAANVPLQNLAASVLSNIASVEPVDDATAAEFMGIIVSSRDARMASTYLQLRPSPADAEATARVLSSGRAVWCMADGLLMEEDAVGALIAAMTFHSTDVGVVETCLRTLMCIGSDEITAHAMAERFELINKTLFVMRACDFDVGVQLAGASLLQTLAANPMTTGAVAASEAAHALAFAVDTHKATLLNGLSAAAAAVANLGPHPVTGAPPTIDGILNAMTSGLEGKPMLAVQLMTRIYEALQMLSSPRAAKAVLELGTHTITLPLTVAALSLLNIMARKGFNVDLPPSFDPVQQLLLSFVHATSITMSLWAQGPVPGADVGIEDLLALRNSIVTSDRTYGALARMVELCAIGSGEATDPSRPAVQLKAGRAVVDVLASCLIGHTATVVLPGRASQERAPTPGLRTKAAPDSVAAFLRCGGLRATGGLMLAYTADTMRLASVSLLPDVAQLTARLLTAQLVVLVDMLGSYTQPTISFASGVAPDAAALSADPVALSAGMVSAVAGAFTSLVSRPGVTAIDASPNPMRLMDLADLAQRVLRHLSTHLQTPEPIGAGSCVIETEAAAIFCFSISRARQQLTLAASRAAQYAHHAAATAAAPSAPMAAAPPMAPPAMGLRTTTMAPGAAVQSLEAASAAAAAGGAGASAGRRPLTRMGSKRGMLGQLGTEEGLACAAWADSKSSRVVVKIPSDGSQLNVYAVTVKKGGAELSLLATVRPHDFTAARVGAILVGGKVKKQGGFFKSGPKVDRCICLDRHGDTILQLELDSPAQAEQVRAILESFAT